HSQSVWSLLVLANVDPSGLQATRSTCAVCPESVWSRHPQGQVPFLTEASPLATSHSLTVPSQLPLAKCVPSGAKASPATQPVCPVDIWIHVVSPVPAICHNQMAPLTQPQARRLPSGLQANACTLQP